MLNSKTEESVWHLSQFCPHLPLYFLIDVFQGHLYLFFSFLI